MMNSKLDLLEQYLQKLIESGSDLIWRDERVHLVRKLIHAIEAEMENDLSGAITLPSAYSITLSPAKYALWHADKDLLDSFSLALHEAAVETGLNISGRPVITLEVAPDTQGDEMHVHISRHDGTAQNTAVLPADAAVDPSAKQDAPANAFLILEDGAHFPINRCTVNIGRRTENELVINDPHVSREHAQIRLVQNTFYIFDLNSRAGTWVNGRKIDQYMLHPGDVISISDHPIIFVYEETAQIEESTPTKNLTHTTRMELNDGKADGKA
jgi:hypothetical protein